MSPTEIENLVREVLRRLSVDNGPSPVAPSVVPATSTKVAAAVAAKVEPAKVATIPSGTAVIRDSLVTLDLLADRLTGITRVLVSPRAVITPAAVDELRKRGVSIVRSADAVGGRSLGSLEKPFIVTLASDGLAPLRTDLVSVLRRSISSLELIDNCASPKLPDVLKELASRIISSGRAGLLLTTTTAVACALANRVRGIRAIVATSGQSIDDAAETLAPNLVIVDRSRVNVWQLRAIATRMVSHGAIEPATPWNTLL